MNIIKKHLPDTQFYKVVTSKRQVVLHHTVSNSESVDGDINWWLSNAERVGAHYIIKGDGTIYETVDPQYWIHHLGIKESTLKQYAATQSNIYLNRHSIGIEIDSAGGLLFDNNRWTSSFGKTFSGDQIHEVNYRSYKAFQKYSDKQIESLDWLLCDLCTEHSIPYKYREDMWDISKDALNGIPGVFSHTSYRPDKSDIYPDPRIIQMLKNQ